MARKSGCRVAPHSPRTRRVISPRCASRLSAREVVSAVAPVAATTSPVVKTGERGIMSRSTTGAISVICRVSAVACAGAGHATCGQEQLGGAQCPQ